MYTISSGIYMGIPVAPRGSKLQDPNVYKTYATSVAWNNSSNANLDSNNTGGNTLLDQYMIWYNGILAKAFLLQVLSKTC